MKSAPRTRVRVAAVLAAALGAVMFHPAAAHAAPAAGADMWVSADVSVTVNNGKVSVWADRTGNGHTASMATVVRQPSLVNGALNGLPVIRFAGSQSLYLNSFINPNHFTVFIVGKNSKPTESYSMILGPGGNSPNNQIRWENGSQSLVVGTGNNLPTTVSSIGNTRVYHALAVRYDGSTLRVYRDGNLVSTRALTTSGPFTLASIGSWYSSYYLIGDLAEIISYSSALSDADRTATDSYLRSKYALP